MDKDLLSVQQARDLIQAAKISQENYASFSHEQINKIIKEISYEISMHSEHLAKLAYEETGYGRYEDKIIKNKFASENVYEYIKDMKTIGILKEENFIMEIGVPVGVIAALIPSTNPTSTVIYKTLIALKSGNAIIFSPHPNAKNCIIETVKLLQEISYNAGVPEGIIGVIDIPSAEGTNELMKNKDISLILATGGEAMVKAAYSSGTPAIGVGPGNGPAFIEKTADIKMAVKKILDSKTFDNGVISASEQFIVVEKSIKDEVIEELKKQGGYFLSNYQSNRLANVMLRGNGSVNPKIVGKDPQQLAEIARIEVPKDTRVLISEQDTVSLSNPFSREKLCTVLAFYIEDDCEKASERCIEILNLEGKGHTMMIHTQNMDLVTKFALKKPVSRLLVNTMGSFGGIGATTNLAPSFTLGCGSAGGSSTTDNITPMNLIDIRRVAYGVREIEDFKNNRNISDIDISIEELVKKIVLELKK